MADWFKFYNDGLDEPRFQFAISEHSEVTSVWLVILSEASKKRSATITWRDQDFELFGFARKINVSVPILNECINLLERIGYITRTPGEIRVEGWDARQSDYAKGLAKGYYKATSKTLASNSLVSTIRGEERRGDKKRVQTLGEVAALPAPASKPKLSDGEWLESLKANPTYVGIDVGLQYGKMVAWCDVNRKQPTRRRFVNWLNRADKPLGASASFPSGAAPINGARTVLLGKELERVELQIKTIRQNYQDHQTWRGEDIARVKELKAKRDEIRKELNL